MFNRKCPNCLNRIDRKFDFCPYCGNNLKNKKEDYGLLGNSDEVPQRDSFQMGLPIEQLIGKMLKDMPNMVKQLEKEMSNMNMNNSNNKSPFPPGVKIRFAINGKEIDLGANNPSHEPDSPPKKIIRKISEEKAKRFAELPRKEPVSKMKRLANKIIYELQTPGVENLNDVVINQLETSIEVKALSENAVYTKTLNINLPIIKYGLSKGNLILEFQTK